MKKLVLTAVLGSTFCFGAYAESMSGFISDSHCGAKHATASEKNTACADKCIKGGADPVLVSDGKVMKFDADSKEKATAMAGKMVKIDGTMSGDTIKINSIDEAK